jgi:hypothetical protein
MKTSLAIVLATAALMISATASVAIAGYSNKSLASCGVVDCPKLDQAPRPSVDLPGPYRGQM